MDGTDGTDGTEDGSCYAPHVQPHPHLSTSYIAFGFTTRWSDLKTEASLYGPGQEQSPSNGTPPRCQTAVQATICAQPFAVSTRAMQKCMVRRSCLRGMATSNTFCHQRFEKRCLRIGSKSTMLQRRPLEVLFKPGGLKRSGHWWEGNMSSDPLSPSDLATVTENDTEVGRSQNERHELSSRSLKARTVAQLPEKSVKIA